MNIQWQRQSSDTDEKIPDEKVLQSMWMLFKEIGKFLDIPVSARRMRPGLNVFIDTRIRLYPSYLEEYKNASEVIEELISELGKTKGFKKLFTDTDADIRPAATPLARARQRVVNEFIFLQMVLSGKMFGKEFKKKRKNKTSSF